MSGTQSEYTPAAVPGWAGTGVTDANGNVTIPIPAGRFAAAPVAAVSCQSANANLVDVRITALTATSITVNVQQALAVTLLGLSILAAKVPAPNVTVHVLARAAG